MRPIVIRKLFLCVVATLSVFATPFVRANDALAVMTANFCEPAKAIAPLFERGTGHRLVFVNGVTTKFHTQIRSGTPIQVLLSADDKTPARLEKEASAVAGSRFTMTTPVSTIKFTASCFAYLTLLDHKTGAL
jgi:molybdate transport system substrate-binding protein